MGKKEMEYLKKDCSDVKVLRAEVMFTPLLVVLPLVVSVLLIYNWFYRGFLIGISAFDGELMLGIIILVGNLMFDVPFLKSLTKNLRKI